MSHFTPMCCSSPLNPQVLFYDGHASNFDDRALDILHIHNMQYFILKAGEYVHDQPNDNGPNMNIDSLYGNSRMNWTRHHGTLKFIPAHINSVLVETWEAFKLPSATTTQKAFKNTHLLLIYPPDIGTIHQSCLAGTQQSNREKAGEIGRIENTSIASIDMEEVRTTGPMEILRE